MSNTMPDSTTVPPITCPDCIARLVEAVHKGDKHPTITLIRECRELGDSWPKAIREVVTFQYQGLGYRLLKVGEAITRAGYKINGEQAVQDAWDKDHPGAVEDLFDAGREYQRRLDIKAAAA